MARKDWEYVGLQKMLTDAIDRFLNTEDAEEVGIKTKSEFVNNLVNNFFEKYRDVYGKEFRNVKSSKGLFDLVNKIDEKYEGTLVKGMHRGILKESISKKD